MPEDITVTRGVNYRKLSKKYLNILLLLFLTPLVFLVLGLSIFNSPNERPGQIEKYNGRTTDWMNKRFEFLNTSFALNSMMMTQHSEKNGQYYPVSDACNRTSDPKEGCIYAATQYFIAETEFFNSSIVFNITDGRSHSYFGDTVQRVRNIHMNKASLRCTTKSECSEACAKRYGYWLIKEGYCNITQYLHQLCYRIRKSEQIFVLDTSSFVSKNGVGCFYSNSWSPYMYKNQPSNQKLRIEIHLNSDPIISASLLTSGCSDAHLNASTTAACFGQAHQDQVRMAHLLILVGLGLFTIEAIATFITCFLWVGKKRHTSPTRILSPSYEQIFTPLTYAELHPVDLPDELAALGTRGLHERLATNGTLRVPKPTFGDSLIGPVEILNM